MPKCYDAIKQNPYKEKGQMKKKNLTKAKKQKEINDATKRNKTKNSTPPSPPRAGARGNSRKTPALC